MRPARTRLALLAATALGAGLATGVARAKPADLLAAAPAVSFGSPVAQTVYLALRDPAGAEAYARAVQTPGALYHRFLSRPQFVKRFAPTDADIATVENALVQLGYTITSVFPNHLAIQATAPAAATNAALGVTLKRVTENGHSGIVPFGTPHLPTAFHGLVHGIGGLDTVHVPHSMLAHPPGGLSIRPIAHAAGTPLTGGTPGYLLPQDFAARYDVDPIYAKDITGRGATIGIVTLANFAPSDAFEFWQDAGIKTDPHRLTLVDVDGGLSGAPQGGESSLDVEESGGLAPDAAIRVYVGSDTGQAFTDGFEAAASENIVDTVSASWGGPELWNFAEPSQGIPSSTYLFDAFHDVFLEMGIQGQSIYAAAGDNGAYDESAWYGSCPAFGTPTPSTPVCNTPYTVIYPGSDPAVTSAGGTTIPVDAPLYYDPQVTVTVAVEQAWGARYVYDESVAQGKPFDFNYLFPGGGGGGVSAYFARPYYQQGVSGMTRTMPGQSWTQDTGTGPVTLLTLPAHFAGRNLPDVSTDADPVTGYQYISNGAVSPYGGGTSFVAPQLNGVTALAVQGLGGRVGLLNNLLYGLGETATDDITVGDNWGYQAHPGYDNTTGLGTLNAAKLADALLRLKAIYGR